MKCIEAGSISTASFKFQHAFSTNMNEVWFCFYTWTAKLPGNDTAVTTGDTGVVPE